MKTVQKRLGLRASLGALLFVIAGGACAQIAGIEDRNFEGTGTNTNTLQCEEYCALVGNLETGLDGVCPQNYTTEATCMGVCGKLPPGNPDESIQENNVACRMNQARFAQSNEGAERESFCQAAGPGGNGACGSNCEAYCMLVERDDVCGEDRNAKIPDCVEKCAAFGDSKRYHVGGGGEDEEFDHSGDTVQCRLVHVSSSASTTADDAIKDMHCAHADVHASLWCIAPEVTCQRYCDVLEVACVGDNEVYEDRDQCLATCAELEFGDPEDDVGDTVGCRTWHGNSALLDAANHCPHAGPTGDGHCGHDTETEFAACRPYCRLLEAACPTEFGLEFEDGDECVADCDASDASFGAAADQRYTVETAPESGDTLSCRTFQAVSALGAVHALGDDPLEVDVVAARAEFCPAAFGAAPCN